MGRFRLGLWYLDVTNPTERCALQRHHMRAGGQDVFALQPPTSCRRSGARAASVKSDRLPRYASVRVVRGPPQPRSWGVVTPSVSLPMVMNPFQCAKG